MDYEVIDISGDVGIRAVGADCAEALVNAGIGMYSLITDLQKIGEERPLEIRISSNSPEGLFVNFLNELIFHFDTYNFIGRRIEFSEFREGFLKAKIFGDEFDPARHEQRLLLKAATYHNIRVEKNAGRCEVEVIFDI
jgi:SHS2 domain-containing protein